MIGKDELRNRALKALRLATNDESAEFRKGQWESIKQALSGKRALIAQRTGWGKSYVYFIATKLMREAGSGPTLLVSPLLSLIRNQIQAAARLGLNVARIDSSNKEEWRQIYADLAANCVDILFVSPERLANAEFGEKVMARVGFGLLVVDEAHCISDWGYDFRPDYRRISGVIKNLPRGCPVIATTATANDRVVNDIEKQFGADLNLSRGKLARESLY